MESIQKLSGSYTDVEVWYNIQVQRQPQARSQCFQMCTEQTLGFLVDINFRC